MKNTNPSRREFLRHASAMSAAVGSAAAPLALNLAALGTASAQAATDYKAIVCIFLFGGNDSMNTVLPTDSASWANYTAVRNQAPDPIALLAPGTAANPAALAGTPARLGGVLPIHPLNAQGRSFALHPAMGALQTMFDADKRLAILANTGPLVMPTSKAQMGQRSHPKPASLFSHNDQQNTWQSFRPEGATKGWGGRMGDLLASRNAHTLFTAVSTSGNAVWLTGETVRQYQIGYDGAIRIGADANGLVYGSAAVAAALERIVTRSRGTHVIEADLAAVSQRSIDAELALRNALKPAANPMFGTPVSGAYDAKADPKLQVDDPLTGSKSPNTLAQQLQVVARMIEAGSRGATGAKRQLFFVSLGGFDTHGGQNRGHAGLMARLAHAMRYFDTALGAVGVRQQVTTFTASDFGRSFTSNGDGTDHGWGAHHFVMGGAVKGSDLYGNFPVLGAKNSDNNSFDSSPNQLRNGVLLPENSVDQLGATMGRWMGLSNGQLLDVFPNLKNFDASKRDLGFMV